MKVTGEDYFFTGLKLKRKERKKTTEWVTFLDGKENIYETWIQSLVRCVLNASRI